LLFFKKGYFFFALSVILIATVIIRRLGSWTFNDHLKGWTR